MTEPIIQTEVLKFSKGEVTSFDDTLAVEEPLEIRLICNLNGKTESKNISITMRTPGNDTELAVGFLFTEGILDHYSQVKNIHVNNLQNNIAVELNIHTNVNLEKLKRHFYTTSSCGVCGKESIEAIKTVSKFNDAGNSLVLNKELLLQLPHQLNANQGVFSLTGGIHASALFDMEGKLVALREDVGRHNALDKLIGRMFIENKIPLEKNILLLSGRASFELIQKAVMAGIRAVAAVGAPSSLAVELAKEYSVTLIGFLRDDRFNVYTNYHLIN